MKGDGLPKFIWNAGDVTIAATPGAADTYHHPVAGASARLVARAVVARFNPNHVESGPDGGQFTSGDGGGGASGGGGSGGAAAAGSVPYTDAQAAALAQWGGTPDTYQQVNSYLRSPGAFANSPAGSAPGAADAMASLVTNLDGAVAANTLSADTVLYRGITGDAAMELAGSPDIGALVGQTVTDAGFVATSRDEGTAWASALGEDGGVGVAFQIQVPAGTPAADLSGIAAAPGSAADESEVLLGRGTSFTITGVDYTQDDAVVLMTATLAHH